MEYVKRSVKIFVDVEDGSHITTSVAIVRSRPNSDQVLVLEPVLESVHDELMSPSNQLDVIDMVEFGSHLRAEEPSGTSWGHSPGLNFFRI